MNKSLITSVFVFFLSLSSVIADPGDATKVYALNLSSWNSAKVDIKVVDQYGSIVFEEVVVGGTKMRSYKFSDLPRGSYTIQVSDSQRMVKYPIQITNLGIVEGSNAKEVFKPSFKISKQQGLFNVLALNERVKISIADEAGEVFFQEQIKNKSTVNRSYDLSKLPAGSYAMTVVVGDEVFEYPFIK